MIGMETTLPPQYLAGLSMADKARQSALIKKSMADFKRSGKVEDRPRVSDAPTKRSVHVTNFEKRYGFSVTDKDRVRELFPDTDIKTILAKGAAAYATSGSRPNVTVAQWSNARLASVLTGGPSLRVDASHVGPISLRKIRAAMP